MIKVSLINEKFYFPFSVQQYSSVLSRNLHFFLSRIFSKVISELHDVVPAKEHTIQHRHLVLHHSLVGDRDSAQVVPEPHWQYHRTRHSGQTSNL